MISRRTNPAGREICSQSTSTSSSKPFPVVGGAAHPGLVGVVAVGDLFQHRGQEVGPAGELVQQRAAADAGAFLHQQGGGALMAAFEDALDGGVENLLARRGAAHGVGAANDRAGAEGGLPRGPVLIWARAAGRARSCSRPGRLTMLVPSAIGGRREIARRGHPLGHLAVRWGPPGRSARSSSRPAGRTRERRTTRVSAVVTPLSPSRYSCTRPGRRNPRIDLEAEHPSV